MSAYSIEFKGVGRAERPTTRYTESTVFLADSAVGTTTTSYATVKAADAVSALVGGVPVIPGLVVHNHGTDVVEVSNGSVDARPHIIPASQSRAVDFDPGTALRIRHRA